MKILAAILCLLFIFTSSPAQSRQPIEVSLVQLIANPVAYNGKHVRAIGFACIEFEGTALYLHEDDYKHAVRKNAVWLDIGKGEMKNFTNGHLRYILVEGMFDADWKGHRGSFSGAVKNITRFQLWQKSAAQKREPHIVTPLSNVSSA